MVVAGETIRNVVAKEIASRVVTGTHRATGIRYRYVRGAARGSRQGFLAACVTAVVAAHLDPELAKAEIETLLAGQLPDGFIGDWNGWKEGPSGAFRAWREHESGGAPSLPHGGRVQPPILAQTVERVATLTHDFALLPRLVEPLDRYYQWLLAHRTFGRDKFLTIFAPAESAMPHSLGFDEMLGVRGGGTRLRRTWRHRQIDGWNALAGHDSARMLRRAAFVVQDPLMNAAFAEGLMAMARIHRRCGDARMADEYETRSKSLRSAMVEHMWDESRGAFFPLHGLEEIRGSRLTIGGLVPLILDDLPRGICEAIVERHLQNRGEFLLRYPFATAAASDPGFDARGGDVGRGPTSMFANWLLVKGLRAHGFTDLAEQVTGQSTTMVAQVGLWECYSSLSGGGLGARGHLASGLALDMAMS